MVFSSQSEPSTVVRKRRKPQPQKPPVYIAGPAVKRFKPPMSNHIRPWEFQETKAVSNGTEIPVPQIRKVPNGNR